jgi:6-phosphogluconolactonase
MRTLTFMTLFAAAFGLLVSAGWISGVEPSARGEWLMYIGTYTQGSSKGIYGYRFDAATGEAKPIGLVAETENPSFIAIHPNQRFLYAANETSTYKGESAGSISAFAIDEASGRLKLLNSVSSKGSGPCHIAIDKTGKWLFVANYDGGSGAAFQIRDDFSLSEATTFVQHQGSSVNRERQSAPHAHAATPSPDNRFVLVADLGLDRIFSYRLDPVARRLAPGNPPFATVAPGSGPRHLAFRRDGAFVYAINEMVSTVMAFRYDSTGGSLHELQTISTLPVGYSADNSAAEIAVDAAGRFLYASNRGHDSIAIFKIDGAKGTLTAAGHASTLGRTPRHFAIDPTGRYLVAANQDSGSGVVFRIDTKTGGLVPTGATLSVPFPVCVAFAAALPGKKKET